MNAVLSPRLVKCLVLAALGFLCLPLIASAGSVGDAHSASLALQANIIFEFASDRTRMIQISVVVVAIGCAMMWWYR